MFSFENVKSEEGCWLGRVTISEDLPYFEGHFHARPILPAVAQLKLLECFLSLVERKACVIVDAVALKFIGIIAPFDVVDISLDVKGDVVRFRLSTHGKVCSRGSFSFGLKA